MHDGVYPFELSIVSFDVILECFGFIRDPVVFSFRIYVDGSTGPYPRACPIGSTNPVYWKVPVTGGTRFSEVGWPSSGVRVLGSPAQASVGHALLRSLLLVFSHVASGSSAWELRSAESYVI
ncbi:hypothetical protein F2Q70_00004139 [Brassica cretica]|uniref:Uncharacterized protein n=1 Tax=Brassica cretica TaxID=69181 RepID=A0A8S9IZD0_BRACR|nr:hypothetical protein F2Q70_00004139 [Brassica cretica]